MLTGYRLCVTEESAVRFSLTDEKLVFQAPATKRELHNNCVVIFQAIVARERLADKGAFD